MIKLFNPKENNFNSAGIATLMPIKLIETKKISLNGWFIDVELPMKYKDLVKQDMLAVIKSKSKLQPQAFRIKNIEYTKRKIKFQAEHVMFDARDYYLVDARPTKVNAHTALNYVNDRTDKRSPFTFSSNVNNTSTAYFLDKTLLEAMETIEDRWGGFFDANNWHIELKKSIGIDRGEVISYGKNLEDIKVHEDWSNVVTRIYPVGFDGVRLPEVYIDADVQYPTPYTKRIDFETEYEDDDRTEENLIPELRENALEYLEKNKYPRVNYEIKSDINQRMEIGDTVHVKHPLVDLVTEVQEYEYNVLTERVVKLVFGNYTRDVKQKFDKIKEDIDRVILQTSKQEAITQHQTDLINNLNKNGHVYIDDNQILILDKLPKENAKYVWRWNMGGLAFSENGVEGPFKQAWTIDGTFNTDFISAGSIMTNHLSSDVGASLDLSSNTAINQIVSDIESLNHHDNVIPNLNGNLENYMGWEFENTRSAPFIKGMPFRQFMPFNINFEIKTMDNSLSEWGLSFFANGTAITGMGYVVPTQVYSFRAKRHKGTQLFSVTVKQYDKDKKYLRDRKISFNSPSNYEAFTIKLMDDVRYVRLAFDVNATPNNRLELTEMMFNRGNPKEWQESAGDVKLFAQSEFKVLDDEIRSTVEDVKVVDGKVEQSKSQITQLASEIDLKVEKDGIIGGINASPETVKIKSNRLEFDNAVGKNVDLSGKITANSGKVGAYDITSNSLRGNDIVLESNQIKIKDAIISSRTYSGGQALDFNATMSNFGRPNEVASISVGGNNFVTQFSSGARAVRATSLQPVGRGENIGGSSSRFDSIYLRNQPNVSSDIRHKSMIEDIPQDLLERLSNIKPKQYVQNGKVHFGYIAQDVERELYKYCVDKYGWENASKAMEQYAFLYKSESHLSLLYGEIAVLKDAQREKEIKELKEEVQELKGMLKEVLNGL